ncbi:MAG: nucleotidyltransferase family protein [bacterium]
MSLAINVPQEKIKEFCQKHRIRKLSFFGSVLRDDFGPDSDVDVLVEFEPEARVGYFELFDMEEELSRVLGGHKIDIRTPDSLSKYFRDEVLQEAENLYVQT